MDLKLFGIQLQRLRKQAGLSQERLVAALDQLAQASSLADYRVIDGTLISRWEQARVQKGRQWKPTRPYVLHLIRLFANYLERDNAQVWADQAGYRLTPQELEELFPLSLSDASPQQTASKSPKLLNGDDNHTDTSTSQAEPSSRRGKQDAVRRLTQRIDIGEMPVMTHFHGRTAEVAEVERWLLHESKVQHANTPLGVRARLVAVIGMGGVGKTALVAHVVKRVAEKFDFVIWRSLLNAPPLAEILHSWLQFLSRQTLATLPASLEAQIQLLMHYLRQERCLLVLDNLESLLEVGEQTGQMRPGYEAYAQLLQQVGGDVHNSCLLLTSREQPQGLDMLLRNTATTRLLALTGLDAKAGEALLLAQGLTLLPPQVTSLIEHYSGNPLALQIVANAITDWFAGDVDAFQREGVPVFDDIRAVLDQQFARLSDLERELLIWLAIERAGVTALELRDNLVAKGPQRIFLETLRSLERRSLLIRQANGFTLQNVVIEYVTDRLIERIGAELASTDKLKRLAYPSSGSSTHTDGFPWLNRYALLKATAKEYVRQSQERLILQPIGEQLLSRFGKSGRIAQINQILAALRTASIKEPQRTPGYAGGNLLNLLIHINVDITGYDFSRLHIWQAYLQGIDLPAVNFAQADLRDCVFTKNFGLCRVLAFTPDGDLLAGGMSNGEIHLWQPNGGQPVAMLKAHDTRIWDIAFSPDGQFVASGSKDLSVRLLERHSGQCCQIFVGHTDWVRAVAFHPGGQIVASGSQDHTVRLWDVQSGRLLHILDKHSNGIMDVAFSPDGVYLASVGIDQTIRLWNVDTGQECSVLREHQACVYTVQFSPDGRHIATGSDDLTVRIWEVAAIIRGESNPCRWILTGHSRGIYVTAFSPDGRRLFSGGAEATIRVWDVESGELVHTLVGHQREVNALAVSPNGDLLATGESDTSMIYLWDLNTQTRARYVYSGYRNWTNAIAFHPHLPLLAGASADGKIYLWNAATGQYLQTLRGEKRMSRSLAFSHSIKHDTPDLTEVLLAVGSTDHTAQLWSVHIREMLTAEVDLLHSLYTPDEIHAVAFSRDSQTIIAGGYDGAIHLWHVATGQLLRTFQIEHDPRIKGAALSADGRWLAAGSHNPTVDLWNLSTGEHRQLQGHTAWTWNVVFHPNGQILASGGMDRTVHFWDAQTGQVHQVLPHKASLIYALTFNGDGTRLAVGTGEATIYLWDTHNLAVAPTTPPALVYKLQGHFDVIQGLAFSADDLLLASASLDGTINVWDVQTGECLHTLYAPGPYADMNIVGVTSITEAQREALKALGATTT